jgi:flagellin-like hook-associated protein FlgL
MNDKNQNDDIDEATIVVSAHELDDATIVVSKKQLEAELAAAQANDLDDATIVVSKKQLEAELAAAEAESLDDATIVVSKKQLEAELVALETEVLDEATVVVSGKSLLEEATITTSGQIDESTTTAPNGGINSHGFGNTTNTFETLGEPAPLTRPITTVIPTVEEPDAEIVVETYVDPDEANEAKKTRRLVSESDELIERLSGNRGTSGASSNRLHEAAERLRAMEKPAKSQSKVALSAAIIGALAIGGLIAILFLKG